MDTLCQLTAPDMASVVDNLLSINVPKYEIINKIDQAAKEAYIIGDDYSYVYHKTLLLEAVELSTLENKDEIALAIKEELFNITYKTFPDQAIKFGDELYDYYKDIDEAKTLDILGIMSVAFEESGNYLAAVECVDRALEKIDAEANQIAGMLLYYSKINSILQLGRYEEVINIIKNNILPVLELYFSDKTKEITTLSHNNMQYIELNSLYILTLAYALQGSAKATETSEQLFKKAHDAVDTEFTIKAQLANGVIKLLQGENDEIQNILNSTKESIPSSKDATINTLLWLILKTVSAYFRGEYSDITNDLVMLANFCQNVKMYALDPVIRGLLVKIALREGHAEEAENLAYDLFYRCSNNQWTLGALLNWFMYCEIAIYKENYEEAIKVAEKALDVAEKSNTNNIFFTALLKLKIAQIYGLRGDYDIAKINLAESSQLAEINGYTYITAMIGIIGYDILLKQITVNPAVKNDNISLLYKYLLASQDAVEKLQNSDLSMFLKKKLEDIFNFAKENNINL
ncbi:MAG: tetratricopeptide repeat protein [Candidatus Gastranaerophilales bacterium]|nr:tetratricopeptide repeat protein [Candidatus Gastranaerophilales bacterium]